MLAKLKRQLNPLYGYMGGGDSGGSSGPSTTTTISKSEPPAFVQPWSETLMSRGAALSNTPYAPYDGQKLASMNPYQEVGLQATAQRAMSGSPTMNAANDMLTRTMNGDYMRPDSNPYLASNVNTAMNAAKTQINSQFGGSNYGTTAHQETLGRTLGEVAGQMYGQNYQDERTQQMRAAAYTPQYAQQDYADAQALIGVGDAYRNDQQSLLNQRLADWTEAQQDPYKKLDTLASTIATASGGYANSASSSPNPYQTTPMASMIGGGLLGGSIGSQYGYGGAGALAGGALGLWG
jgi:hypothetical protein